jgi:hypothetical protein
VAYVQSTYGEVREEGNDNQTGKGKGHERNMSERRGEDKGMDVVIGNAQIDS